VVRPISEKQFESSGMKNVLNNKFATTIYDEVKTFASYLSLEAHPMPEPDRIKSKDVNQIGLVSYSQDFNTHLDFLTNLGYQFVKISDPAELSSALANHQIFCVLVNPSDETALTEIDAYEESFKMIGDIEKKPKCHLMSFYSQNSVIQPKDLSDLWVTVSKTSDLRVFEHVLEKIL
jgi:hypothetical protein